MENNINQNVPKTIGELRKRLADLGNPWEVDPQLNDDEPLPDPPRGGQSDEEIPEEDRLVSLAPDINIRELIAAQPPENPLLRAHWVELELLNQTDAPDLPAETGNEDEWRFG